MLFGEVTQGRKGKNAKDDDEEMARTITIDVG